ncbi:hypothetical protein AHAS_Ahas09G0193500 [Arachis hypogaea]
MSTFMPTLPPAPRLTLWFNSQPRQGPALRSHTLANPTHGPIAPPTNPTSGGGAISAETMAATSSGTASRFSNLCQLPGSSVQDLGHLRRHELGPPFVAILYLGYKLLGHMFWFKKIFIFCYLILLVLGIGLLVEIPIF